MFMVVDVLIVVMKKGLFELGFICEIGGANADSEDASFEYSSLGKDASMSNQNVTSYPNIIFKKGEPKEDSSGSFSTDVFYEAETLNSSYCVHSDSASEEAFYYSEELPSSSFDDKWLIHSDPSPAPFSESLTDDSFIAFEENYLLFSRQERIGKESENSPNEVNKSESYDVLTKSSDSSSTQDPSEATEVSSLNTERENGQVPSIEDTQDSIHPQFIDPLVSELQLPIKDFSTESKGEQVSIRDDFFIVSDASSKEPIKQVAIQGTYNIPDLSLSAPVSAVKRKKRFGMFPKRKLKKSKKLFRVKSDRKLKPRLAKNFKRANSKPVVLE